LVRLNGRANSCVRVGRPWFCYCHKTCETRVANLREEIDGSRWHAGHRAVLWRLDMMRAPAADCGFLGTESK